MKFVFYFSFDHTLQDLCTTSPNYEDGNDSSISSAWIPISFLTKPCSNSMFHNKRWLKWKWRKLHARNETHKAMVLTFMGPQIQAYSPRFSCTTTIKLIVKVLQLRNEISLTIWHSWLLLITWNSISFK